MQVTLTENAREQLLAFFAQAPNEPRSVRIFPTGGINGPVLTIALDEAKEGDISVINTGITFCMEQQIYDQVGDCSIDCDYMGIRISSQRRYGMAPEGGCSCTPSAGGCGGCSGCH